MMKRRGAESTNRGDKVEIEEIADPVNARDDGDRLFRKVEDLFSELFGLVFCVFGGHDGGERGAWGVEVGRGFYVI